VNVVYDSISHDKDYVMSQDVTAINEEENESGTKFKVFLVT
jgi:hypothetical protein